MPFTDFSLFTPSIYFVRFPSDVSICFKDFLWFYLYKFLIHNNQFMSLSTIKVIKLLASWWLLQPSSEILREIYYAYIYNFRQNFIWKIFTLFSKRFGFIELNFENALSFMFTIEESEIIYSLYTQALLIIISNIVVESLNIRE